MTEKQGMLICGASPFLGAAYGVLFEAMGFGAMAPLYGTVIGGALGLLLVTGVALYQTFYSQEK